MNIYIYICIYRMYTHVYIHIKFKRANEMTDIRDKEKSRNKYWVVHQFMET